MDNYRHLKNLGNDLPVNTTPLGQQGSSNPWTLDQFQTSLGNYGSMNLVPNAEETPEGQLPRQASITQPPILSQTSSDEEFLFQAGVGGSNNNGGYTHGLSPLLFNSNTSLDHDQFQLSDLMNDMVPRSHGLSPLLFNSNTSLDHDQFQLSDLMNDMVPRSHQYDDESRSTYEPQQPTMSIPDCYTDATQGDFSSGFMGIGDQTINQNITSLVPNVATIPSGPMAMMTSSSSITPIPISGKIQKRKGKSLGLPSSNGGHGMRGRVDDVDKKQVRKIKNRESAARSMERRKAKEKETEKEREYWKKKCQDLKKENELLKEMINRPERRLRRTKSDMK